jgi:hypothetical protein
MYDRGNLVLTDWELRILNILRPRVAGEEKFLVRKYTNTQMHKYTNTLRHTGQVRETYPVELAKQELTLLDGPRLAALLAAGKETDTLKKLLMPHFDFGPSLLEHLLLEAGLPPGTKLKELEADREAAIAGLEAALAGGPAFLAARGGEVSYLALSSIHPLLPPPSLPSPGLRSPEE